MGQPPGNGGATNTVVNYNYDDLSRIWKAADTGTGANLSQTYTYDRYGNIKTNGAPASWNPPYGTGYQSNNRYVTGPNISYDNDGNLLSDTFHSYTWDDEDKLSSVDGGTAFGYDAFGRAVEKNGYEFIQAPNLPPIRMLGQSTSFARIPLPGGAYMALYYNGIYGYEHRDWVGATRLLMGAGDTLASQTEFSPFGIPFASAGPWFDFGGNDMGAASGEYDTPNRSLHPIQGRWIQPDPAGLAAVDPSNPQSWNRYAYVNNNPLSAVDPLGLYDDPACNHTDAGCGGMDSGGMGGWDFGYGGGRGGEGMDACGVDIFCIQKGGMGPFGSPVAQIHCDSIGCMTGSSVFSTYLVGGTYSIDWGAQRQAEMNAAIRAIEKAFGLIASNMGLDPNKQVQVSVQYKAGVWNVSLYNCTADCTVDSNNANASGWPDPITYMHQGNSSWYFGSLFGFDAGHLIGSDPAGAHIDPFGPLNPLHYLIQMPAMLFPGGPVGYTSCSINGGCD